MKKSPSRVRYEKAHPAITIRLSKEMKEILDEIKNESEDLSYADIIKAGLKNVAVEYEKAFNTGYGKGKEDWQIFNFCSICKEKIAIAPGSDAHKELIEYFKNAGYAHITCIRQATAQQYGY